VAKNLNATTTDSVKLGGTNAQSIANLDGPPRAVATPRALSERAIPGCEATPFYFYPAATVQFFDSEKQKTDPPLDFLILENRNAHLYRLGAKSKPVTGSIEDMPPPGDHL
jgi:hypothetical protein